MRTLRGANVLPACGNLDTAFKIRQLMRRVINHQLKGEISPQAHSSINGSATVALKTLEVGELEDKLVALEAKLEMAIAKQKKVVKKMRR